jgi:hypothetical protein
VYGVYVYTAKPAGTFLPWFAPAKSMWAKAKIRQPDIEGTSYIGAPAVLLFPFLLIWAGLWIRRRFYGKQGVQKVRKRLSSDAAHPLIIFLSGVLVWLIATGWIYQIGGGVLIELFPVIGQFRSLGRIAWIFYYVIGISAAYAMFVAVRSMHVRAKKIAMIGAIGILTAFWIWEGHTYLNETVSGRRITPNKTFSQSAPFSDLLAKSGIEPGDFQAILTLPLASVGAEKIKIERGGWFMRQSWQCAWETGLPIVNSVMSRTSISQTMSLIQLISDPYIEKARVHDMDDRPLILLASKDLKPLLKSEKRIIALADEIGVVNDVRVLKLPVDKLQKSAEPRPDKSIYRVDFDDQKTELALSGQGALFTDQPRTETFSFVDTFTTRGVLEYSSWSYLGPVVPVFASIRHEVWNTSGGMVKRTDYNMHNYHPHNVIGNWMETSFFFSVDGSGAVHKFFVEPEGTWFDRIRIR